VIREVENFKRLLGWCRAPLASGDRRAARGPPLVFRPAAAA